MLGLYHKYDTDFPNLENTISILVLVIKMLTMHMSESLQNILSSCIKHFYYDKTQKLKN